MGGTSEYAQCIAFLRNRAGFKELSSCLIKPHFVIPVRPQNVVNRASFYRLLYDFVHSVVKQSGMLFSHGSTRYS